MKKTKIKLPSEDIRKIWQEMKELKCIRGKFDERGKELAEKYIDIDTSFGNESTLHKAIIYFLDEKFKKQQQIIKNSYK